MAGGNTYDNEKKISKVGTLLIVFQSLSRGLNLNLLEQCRQTHDDD